MTNPPAGPAPDPQERLAEIRAKFWAPYPPMVLSSTDWTQKFTREAIEAIGDLFFFLASKEADLTALRAERDAQQEAIEAFNRNDHDEQGAAQTWFDCYIEFKDRALKAEAELAELRARLVVLPQDQEPCYCCRADKHHHRGLNFTRSH